MKRILTLLTAMVCAFCLSACAGGNQKEIHPLISEADAIQTADGIINGMDEILSMGLLEQYESDPELRAMIQEWLIPAVESWSKASEDMGQLVGIIDHQVTYSSDDDMIILTSIQGTVRNAEVEIIVEDGMTKSVTTNVIYSFEEQMQKAGLNTLLGMGTVFCVLILISVIISLFKFIPDVSGSKNAKAAAPAPAKAPAAPAPAPVKTADGNDPALIAVIAAAIAAYEGTTPDNIYFNQNCGTGDAYVVRSIKRLSRK